MSVNISQNVMCCSLQRSPVIKVLKSKASYRSLSSMCYFSCPSSNVVLILQDFLINMAFIRVVLEWWLIPPPPLLLSELFEKWIQGSFTRWTFQPCYCKVDWKMQSDLSLGFFPTSSQPWVNSPEGEFECLEQTHIPRIAASCSVSPNSVNRKRKNL